MRPNDDDRTASRAPSRAQRYPLQLPVRFREVSATVWHTGVTENLSASGAMIRSQTQLMPATLVDVTIDLRSADGRPGGCLAGRGRVVRSFSLVDDREASVFAVTFMQYRLERRQEGAEASAASEPGATVPHPIVTSV